MSGVLGQDMASSAQRMLAQQPASNLTIRQHIAIAVLQGLWIKEGDKGYSYEGAAITALEQADAMLAAFAQDIAP